MKKPGEVIRSFQTELLASIEGELAQIAEASPTRFLFEQALEQTNELFLSLVPRVSQRATQFLKAHQHKFADFEKLWHSLQDDLGNLRRKVHQQDQHDRLAGRLDSMQAFLAKFEAARN